MKKRARESGQATIEFALSMILLMVFVVFFIQLSLVFAWGSYVHYATFMSARAYESGGVTEADQQERAASVIKSTLKKSNAEGQDRLPFIAKGVGGGDLTGASIGAHDQFNGRERTLSWLEGVRYSFKSKLFLTPLGGASGGAARNSLTLTSESWLGRDPSFQECLDFVRGQRHGEIDNGC